MINYSDGNSDHHYVILTLYCLLFIGTDDEQQEYEYLGAWGPRFDKLADMYGQDGESEEEEEQ